MKTNYFKLLQLYITKGEERSECKMQISMCDVNPSWTLFHFTWKAFLRTCVWREWLKMVRLNSFTLGIFEVDVKMVEIVVKVLVYSKSYCWSHFWRYLHGPFEFHGYGITRIFVRSSSIIIYPWWWFKESRFA